MASLCVVGNDHFPLPTGLGASVRGTTVPWPQPKLAASPMGHCHQVHIVSWAMPGTEARSGAASLQTWNCHSGAASDDGATSCFEFLW